MRQCRRSLPRSRRCRSSTSAGAAARLAAGRSTRQPKGAVYRITPDGVWDQLWESRDDAPYDLTFDQNGALIIGTGNKGKIYRLEGDPPRPTLLARASAQQVTAFHKDARAGCTTRPRIRASSSGSPRTARQRGARTNPTCATRRWCPRGAQSAGAARCRPAAASSSTRGPGNTETPDDTWSAWSGPYTNAEGSPMTSPKARYLQWRAVLTGQGGHGPVLTSVTAAYLQRNLRPEVRSITVHPPGIVFQKPFSTRRSGARRLRGSDDAGPQARRRGGSAASPGRPRRSAGAPTRNGCRR